MFRANLTILNALLLVGFLGITVPGVSGAVPKRLKANIDDSRTFVLKGDTRPAVLQGSAQDQGEVDGSMVMPRMSLHFSLTSAQQADLNQFLTALQNRRSSSFHQFLTPEEYAARFGVNDSDIAKVTAWLEGQGFSNVQVARGRMFVSFSGTAAQASAAFRTSIHRYLYNGEAHFANASDPQLPAALNGLASHVGGLHDFHMKPHMRVRPHYTSSLSNNTFLAPDDWTTIYDVKKLYSAGLNGAPLSSGPTACSGSPCSIVVVGQSDVSATDLANFRSLSGLPAKTITTVIPTGDTDPGLQLSSGDEGESDLDLEWSNAIAPSANVLFVTAGSGVENAMAYAIDQNFAPIMSTSYGLCEPYETASDVAAQQTLFSQANTQGMTIVAAAGDAGAADCDSNSSPSGGASYPAIAGLAVDFPGSSPYVTSVGGSEFLYSGPGSYFNSTNNAAGGSAISYIPEEVWNDTAADVALGEPELAAGGGGSSVLFSKPSWQVGTGVPSDGHRDVPDISLTSSPNTDGLLMCGSQIDTNNSSVVITYCTNGFRTSSTAPDGYANDLDVTGGTSDGAPTLSGVLALLVQQTGARLGNINPNLYTVAGISQTAFHDITSGSNIVPCQVGTLNCSTGTFGYSAGIGYDLASGWGSIDAFNLVEQWSADIQVTSSPTSLSLAPGATGTATVTVAPVKNFSGAVSFACTVSSGLANVTCSVPSTTVTTSGSTTVTITAASTAGTPLWRSFRQLPPAGLGLLLLAFGLALATYMLRKRRFVYAFGAAAMLVFVLGTVSCGGGSSSGSTSTGTTGTTGTAESGTVTVTATGGQITNSVSIAVTIQ